jgi:hypothetical protein
MRFLFVRAQALIEKNQLRIAHKCLNEVERFCKARGGIAKRNFKQVFVKCMYGNRSDYLQKIDQLLKKAMTTGTALTTVMKMRVVQDALLRKITVGQLNQSMGVGSESKSGRLSISAHLGSSSHSPSMYGSVRKLGGS